METNLAGMIATIKENNWILENGLVSLKHGREKMIFNDSLTMIWLEIDGVSSGNEIAMRICEKINSNDSLDDVASVVDIGLQILADNGLIDLNEKRTDNWFEEGMNVAF